MLFDASKICVPWRESLIASHRDENELSSAVLQLCLSRLLAGYVQLAVTSRVSSETTSTLTCPCLGVFEQRTPFVYIT